MDFIITKHTQICLTNKGGNPNDTFVDCTIKENGIEKTLLLDERIAKAFFFKEIVQVLIFLCEKKDSTIICHVQEIFDLLPYMDPRSSGDLNVFLSFLRTKNDEMYTYVSSFVSQKHIKKENLKLHSYDKNSGIKRLILSIDNFRYEDIWIDVTSLSSLKNISCFDLKTGVDWQGSSFRNMEQLILHKELEQELWKKEIKEFIKDQKTLRMQILC